MSTSTGIIVGVYLMIMISVTSFGAGYITGNEHGKAKVQERLDKQIKWREGLIEKYKNMATENRESEVNAAVSYIKCQINLNSCMEELNRELENPL